MSTNVDDVLALAKKFYTLSNRKTDALYLFLSSVQSQGCITYNLAW